MEFLGSYISQEGFFLTWYDLAGFAAVFFAFLAFYVQDKMSMRLYGLISAALFGFGIFFYGGVNGLFVTLVSISIKLLSLTYHESRLAIFQKLSPVIAFVFFLFFNPEGWMGVLPAISLIFIVMADTQRDIAKMKLWYFGSAFCWLLYAIHLGSIPAIIYDLVGIFTLAYSLALIKSRSSEGVGL